MVTAQDRGISTVEPGGTVRLKFDTSALHYFGEDGKRGTPREIHAARMRPAMPHEQSGAAEVRLAQACRALRA